MKMMIIFLALAFFSEYFPVSLSDSPSNTTDLLSLLDFMNQITNVDNPLANNWTTKTSFCNWIGVTCSPQRQRVAYLTLPNMNLEGTISPSLSNLSFLSILDLSNNSFQGYLPYELGHLPRLRLVDVNTNHLEGNVPSGFFQSRTIETLSLAYNQFNGDLWNESWNVPELRILNLTRNNLTGSIHPSIGNITNLERMILYGNLVGGDIPREIGNMSRLVELDLSHNHFTGSIPSSIFNITSLRAIYLSNNSLSGSFLIDGENGFLSLEEVDLSYNELTGEFPSNLCRLRELISLDVSHNNLTGQIPRNIDCLSKLESLYMTENNIGGTIPPSFGNISNLQFIGCVGNRIRGNIPYELGNLLNLQMLGFDFNNLSGEIPPVIFNLSSLVYIALTDNDLSGRIPLTAGLNLPNLEGIYVADNLLEGEIPISITNASKLQELELSYNLFVGTVPNDLGNLRDLVFLNLGGNRLMNEPGNSELGFMNSLVECRNLQFVIVGNNPLNGILPDSVQNFSSSIEMFNIENAQLYGRIPRGIGNMRSMISLFLNGNNLTGEIPVEIGNLSILQRLYLQRNKLQGDIPVELCNLIDIGEIILSENSLSGPIPDCIGNLGRIQRLMLGFNRFTSSLPSTLWEIRGLLFLNISHNSIRGRIPPEIGMIQNCEGLDLSSNLISGIVPTTFGELRNLRYLSLSNNSFDGSIPTSLGNLMSLEYLDLSSNNLSGSIPVSLERLSYLAEINISYNHLKGQVPFGGIFSNSSPQSFQGNNGLCGMQSLGLPLCETENGSSSFRNRLLKIIIPVIASIGIIAIILFSILVFRKRRRVIKLEDAEQPRKTAYQMISYRELVQATDSFSETNLIGEGGSGSVFKGVLSDGTTTVAVKVLNLKDEDAVKRFDAECEILRRIRHRNLVKVITTCSNDDLRAIVLQYMPNGSLESWLHGSDIVLDLVQRIEIMIDVARAIEYLHHGYDYPIVHCDLKPGNVLLDADMVARVSDFGISKILAQDSPNEQTKTLGTIGYIAPEYGSEGTVSTCGDVYSFGIMVMEMLTRRKPTDETFSENISLRQWVAAAYPKSLAEVIDSSIFEVEDDSNCSRVNTCTIAVIELALDCSEEAAEERIDMKEAVVRLVKIKERLLETKETPI